MKKLLLLLAFLCANSLFAQTGTISAISIEGRTCTAAVDAIDGIANQCQGTVVDITITGLGTGGTYVYGLGTNNIITASSNFVFQVTGTGFTSSGGGTTPTRLMWGTYRWRQPYPNNASPDESANGGNVIIRVALNDDIYTGETVVAQIAAASYTDTVPHANLGCTTSTCPAVTNNSSLAYPSALARWATVPYQRVTGAFAIEAVAFDKPQSLTYGGFGFPSSIAGVATTCTDGTNTVNVLANETVSNTGGLVTPTGIAMGSPGMDKNAVTVYAANYNASSFIQADQLTCNFTIYPAVGTTSPNGVLTSATGITTPTEKLAPLYLLACPSGATGQCAQPAAAIDPTNGVTEAATDCTPTFQCEVYATLALAEAAYASSTAASYKTIGDAAKACKNYNNANNGHSDPGGCIEYLETGTNVYPGVVPASNLGAQKTWAVLTGVPGTCGSGAAAITSATGTTSPLNVGLLEVTSICLTSSSATLMTDQTASGSTDTVWVDNDVINHTGSTDSFYQWYLGYATRNTIVAIPSYGFGPQSTSRPMFNMCRGNAAPTASHTTGVQCSFYAVLGNTNITATYISHQNLFGGNPSDGSILAYNGYFNLDDANSWNLQDLGGVPVVTGIAIIQNVAETTVGSTPPMAEVFDQGYENSNNILQFYNTIVGNRYDGQYNYTAGGKLWTLDATGSGYVTGDTGHVTGCAPSNPYYANYTVTASLGAVTALTFTSNGGTYSNGTGCATTALTGVGTGLTITLLLGGAPVYTTNWSKVGNFYICFNWNGDTVSPYDSSCTGSTSCRTGNMNGDFSVGEYGNQKKSDASSGAFSGIFKGLNTIYLGNLEWVADGSLNQNPGGGDAGTGNGNYRPLSNSSLANLMPCGTPPVVDYDFVGQIRKSCGASPGAFAQEIIQTPVFGW